MKLKKLLKVLPHKQAIRLVSTIGCTTKHSEVFMVNDGYSIQSVGDCKVISIRSIHDDLQLPDWQDYIEIRLQGGNEND